MPQVIIPARHFTENVKMNYQEHNSALIREFLQNSVDAGSTAIEFEYDRDNRTLIVRDNGCGMSNDTLINALLTMSGSEKNTGSIGGFGAAKEILLFQHECYAIITKKDNSIISVNGKQLEYDYITGNTVLSQWLTEPTIEHGTIFKITFHENYSLDNFEPLAINYLESCQTNCLITWNGCIVECTANLGRLINKNIDWANIYVSDADSNWAIVRINGVKMFEVYVKSNFSIIIEITKPSIDILTVNRDGFQWCYQQSLNELIAEIAVDRGNFGKAYGKHIKWVGKNEAYGNIDFDFNDLVDEYYDKNISSEVEHISQHISQYARTEINGTDQHDIDGILNIIKKESEERSIPYELIDKMIYKVNNLICDHHADFYIKVTGRGFDKIPENLKPNFGKRISSLAKLWKHCIKIVMKSNKMTCNYAIGWVIDADQRTHARHENINNLNIFYLNPILTWMKTSNHSIAFYKMIMIACHEVCHMKHQWHDEYFQNEFEDMLHRTLCHISSGTNSWWKEYMDSKNEII